MSAVDAFAALVMVCIGLGGFTIGLVVGWTKAFHDHARLIERVYDGQNRTLGGTP